MKGKLFGLYSLENAVYFGVRQYIFYGEKLFFGKTPEWADNLKIIDADNLKENDIDNKEKSFLSAYGVLNLLSKEGADAFFSRVTAFLTADSSMVFDCPDGFDYLTVEKLLSKNGFLIYEEQRISEKSKAYLAVKKMKV